MECVFILKNWGLSRSLWAVLMDIGFLCVIIFCNSGIKLPNAHAVAIAGDVLSARSCPVKSIS